MWGVGCRLDTCDRETQPINPTIGLLYPSGSPLRVREGSAYWTDTAKILDSTLPLNQAQSESAPTKVNFLINK